MNATTLSHGERNTRSYSYLLAVIITLLYAVSTKMDTWVLALAVSSFATLIAIHQIFEKKLLLRECFVSAALAVLSAIAAWKADLSPLMVIIPVLMYTIFAKTSVAFIVPVITPALVLLITLQKPSFTEMVVFGCVAVLSIQLNWLFNKYRASLTLNLNHEKNQHYKQETYLSFLRNLSKGEITASNQFPSNDVLGNALYDLGVKLNSTAEADRKRAWQMEGLNELNTIIRSSSDMEGRYSQLISFIVKYSSSNQGGLFVINRESEQKPFVELKACYAYEKHRINQKRLAVDEGLIGQCLQERDIIYLEEIPRHYVHITSGLGLATPSTLVMIPIKYNDEVLGVLELASFKKFETHQMDFLKKAVEVMGGAILAFQRNALTKRMLQESQQLSEELRAQQEEVRQNMEELEATQEHLMREGKEREKLQDELKKSKEFLNLVIDSVPVPVFVKNREHQMILVNKAVCELNNMKREEMLGKSDYDFFSKDEADVFWNAEEKIFNSKLATEKTARVNRHGRETMTIDRKLIIETQDGENFLVGINIDVSENTIPVEVPMPARMQVVL